AAAVGVLAVHRTARAAVVTPLREDVRAAVVHLPALVAAAGGLDRGYADLGHRRTQRRGSARRIVEGADLALRLGDGLVHLRAPGVAHAIGSGAELLHRLMQRAAGGGLEVSHNRTSRG